MCLCPGYRINFFLGTLRGLRADSMVRTKEGKCGWRAAHASMAHETRPLPRNCTPTHDVQRYF
jgi:hypothetical protein